MKSFLITQTDPTYWDKSTMGKERQELEQGSHNQVTAGKVRVEERGKELS